MEKPTSLFKSKRRHALKEIDKKWDARKVSKPQHNALSKKIENTNHD